MPFLSCLGGVGGQHWGGGGKIRLERHGVKLGGCGVAGLIVASIAIPFWKKRKKHAVRQNAIDY